MNSAINFEVDDKAFQKAMREYARATKKDEAYILNRAARNTVFKAISYTPKANKAKIQRVLKRNNLLFKIVAKKKGKPGYNQAEMSREAKKELNRRIRSIGYLKAGWVKAARVFGNPRLGVSSRSKAARGYGIKAKPITWSPFAEIVNRAPGIEKIGIEPLRRAMRRAFEDMNTYAEKKLQETASRYSAR